MLSDLMPQLPTDRPNHLLGIGDEPGKTVQVHPIKPKLKAPGYKRLNCF